MRDQLSEIHGQGRRSGRFLPDLLAWMSHAPSLLRTYTQPAILRASIQLRREALPVFYTVNEFHIIPGSLSIALRWLIGTVGYEHMHRVDLVSNTLDQEGGNVRSALILLLFQHFGICGELRLSMLNKEHCEPCTLRARVDKLVKDKSVTREQLVGMDYTQLRGMPALEHPAFDRRSCEVFRQGEYRECVHASDEIEMRAV